jgi:hypothetical protein
VSRWLRAASVCAGVEISNEDACLSDLVRLPKRLVRAGPLVTEKVAGSDVDSRGYASRRMAGELRKQSRLCIWREFRWLPPPARMPRDSRLLTPPHRQYDRQLIAAQLVATSMIGNGPSQSLYALLAEV